MNEPQYTYILRPMVHTPWGYMQVTITLKAESWYGARRKAADELRTWIHSQREMGRHDFVWLEEALRNVENMDSPAFVFAYTREDKVDVNWFDEREF
jgi:hypothetical protein